MRVSKSTFSICAYRLLNLAARGEQKEFHSFYQFSIHTLSDLDLGEEWAERSYAWMRKFLGLLERIDADLLAELGFPGFSDRMGHSRVFGKMGEVEEILSYLEAMRQQFWWSFRTLGRLWGLEESFAEGDFQRLYDPFLLSGDIWSLIKYQTCVWWNRHLRSPSSEFPKNALLQKLPLFLGTRSLKQFLLRRVGHPGIQYTVFMGLKKSLPPLDPVSIWGSFLDLKKDLTKEPTLSQTRTHRLCRYMEQMVEQLPASERVVDVKSTYSLGASFGNSRKECGVAGEVWTVVKDSFGDSSLLSLYLRGFREDRRLGTIESIYGTGPTDSDVLERYFELVNLPERGQVKPHGILEPLKVRIITKGDAATQVALGGVKDYLRRLCRGKTFQLIRSSLEDPEVEDEFLFDWQMAWKEASPDSFWVSGDFSAATNKCNGAISEMILKSALLFASCPTEIIAMAIRSLIGNEIHFNLSDTRKGGMIPFSDFGFAVHPGDCSYEEKFIQTNGQLMGSIISFPVLCLMNLFCYWESREEEVGAELSLRDLLERFPVTINGDDILFISNKNHYQIWQEKLPEYGFEKSLGKNLCLPDAFTINSVYYRLEELLPERRWVDIIREDYVNLGLINGRKKGDGPRDTISRSTMLGPAFEEYLYSEDFWFAAVAAFQELSQIECKVLRDRAVREFRSVYEAYILYQGWTWEQWLLNHERLLNATLCGRKKKYSGYSIATFKVESPDYFSFPSPDFVMGHLGLFGDVLLSTEGTDDHLFGPQDVDTTKLRKRLGLSLSSDFYPLPAHVPPGNERFDGTLEHQWNVYAQTGVTPVGKYFLKEWMFYFGDVPDGAVDQMLSFHRLSDLD